MAKSEVKKKSGLGKGLSALMAEDYSASVNEKSVKPAPTLASDNVPEAAPKKDENDGSLLSVPVEALHAGKFQPRQHFDETALNELADSIRHNGLMQPIIVRPSKAKSGAYEIIAGERRWRAAQRAELNYVPVLVQELEDKQVLEQALVENIQRQDLNVMEEAEGFQRLMAEFSYTQDGLAKVVGKSRSHVANLLRLLNLPEMVKAMVNDNRLSMGHARAMLALESVEAIEKAAETMVSKGLNVRQAEALCKNMLRGESEPAPKKPRSASTGDSQKDSEIQELENHLSDIMGMAVTIDDKGNKGTIHLHYESLAQLDDILQRLSDSAI